MTDAWGANTFPVRKYNSRTFHLKVRRSRLFRFFRRFPQINVGGDSARIPFLEDAPVSLASPSRRRVGCDSMLSILSDFLESCIEVVATYPSAGGRRVTRRCVFQERNTRGVATNVYLRKTSEKPEKTRSTNF